MLHPVSMYQGTKLRPSEHSYRDFRGQSDECSAIFTCSLTERPLK